MPELQISQSDIESLGRKLGALEPQLSRDERALLLSILWLAAIAMGGAGAEAPFVSRVPGQQASVTVEVRGSLPSIQDQFANAFTPGVSETGGAAAAVSVKLPE